MDFAFHYTLLGNVLNKCKVPCSLRFHQTFQARFLQVFKLETHFCTQPFPFSSKWKGGPNQAKLKYKTFEWILLNHVKPHDCPAQNTRLYYYLYTFCNNHFASIFGYKTQPIFHKFFPTCLRMERYLLKLKIKRLS